MTQLSFARKKRVFRDIYGWSSRYISRNILFSRGKREWCHYVTSDIITATWGRTSSCLRPYGRHEKPQIVGNDNRRNDRCRSTVDV